MNFCPNCGMQFTTFHENRSWGRERGFALWGIFAGLMGGLIGNFIVQSIYFDDQIQSPVNTQILIAALIAMILVGGFLLYFMWNWMRGHE